MKHRAALTLILCTCALSACDLLAPGVVCTTSVERALEIEVVDWASGEHLAGGASGWVRDGDYFEQLEVVGWEGAHPDLTATTLGGAYERGGRYEIVITHPGYETWTRRDVRVTEGVCHVRTVRLTARLVPQS